MNKRLVLKNKNFDLRGLIGKTEIRIDYLFLLRLSHIILVFDFSCFISLF